VQIFTFSVGNSFGILKSILLQNFLCLASSDEK